MYFNYITTGEPQEHHQQKTERLIKIGAINQTLCPEQIYKNHSKIKKIEK